MLKTGSLLQIPKLLVGGLRRNEEESIKTYFRHPREGEKGQFLQVADAISHIQLHCSGVRLNPTRTRDAFRKLDFEEKKIGSESSPNYGKRGFIVAL